MGFTTKTFFRHKSLKHSKSFILAFVGRKVGNAIVQSTADPRRIYELWTFFEMKKLQTFDWKHFFFFNL